MTTMRKVENGLWEGPRVRVERDGSAWRTEMRLRDCGEPIDRITGWFEAHPEGDWHHVGQYRTKERAEKASAALVSGLYLFRAAHSTSVGFVPGTIMPRSRADQELVELLAERELEEPPRGRFPFSPF